MESSARMPTVERDSCGTRELAFVRGDPEDERLSRCYAGLRVELKSLFQDSVPLPIMS